MRATALLIVLLVAHGLVLAGRALEWNFWMPIALIWQDVALVLVFAGLDRLIRKEAVIWGLYVLISIYAAFNVPLQRILSTPMTPAIWRAAGSALGDSITYYLTPVNFICIGSVLAAAVIAPFLVKRFVKGIRPVQSIAAVSVCALVVLIGPMAVARSETEGLERNAVIAYVTNLQPRVRANGEAQDWRRPIQNTSVRQNVRVLERGVAAGLNLILISFESTGAQYLRLWGATNDPTPNLTALAQEGLIFDNAYAVYPESIKGLFSVLCSQYPAFDSRAEDYENISVSSLPAILRNEGYEAALFHSGRFDYLGMREILKNRGFNVMEDAGEISGARESSFGVEDEDTVRHILQWLDSLPKEKLFFLTYLPIAGHHPYITKRPGPFCGKSDEDRYRNALFEGDAALGVLIRGLKERGLFENSCFVIFGDHGEAFGEHQGNFGHTLFIYEENVHVPLLIVLPGLIKESKHVRSVVSLIDVAPTICDLLGIDAGADFQGVSVFEGGDRAALFFTDYSLGLLGLRDGNWKFIYELGSGRTKLYDLAGDPGETRNLKSRYPKFAETARNRVIDWSGFQRGRIEQLRAD